MFINVDEGTQTEGFDYTNLRGFTERVRIRNDTNVIYLEGVDGIGVYSVSIFYTADIPKLIKALQSAYDHVNGIKDK